MRKQLKSIKIKKAIDKENVYTCNSTSNQDFSSTLYKAKESLVDLKYNEYLKVVSQLNKAKLVYKYRYEYLDKEK
jgi:hypothetical protein